jgi:CspA family cold shock protein
MSNFGKIYSYDSRKGAGMISPETGGSALAFNKADLQEQAQEPKAGQRFEYETVQADGGKTHATKLQMQQGQHESATKQAT